MQSQLKPDKRDKNAAFQYLAHCTLVIVAEIPMWPIESSQEEWKDGPLNHATVLGTQNRQLMLFHNQ